MLTAKTRPHEARLAIAAAALLAVASTAPGHAQTASPPNVPEPGRNSYYAAGHRIQVATPVYGDVVVAARDIAITRLVAGDVLAAGWRVELTGIANDDVRMVGGELAVDAPIAGDLTAAGGDVALGPKTHVAGRTWLTGRAVRVEGLFEHEVQIAGGTVQLGGDIRQPVKVVAEKLEILPTARLHSTLSYQSPVEATVASGAIVGPITYSRIARREARQARSYFGVSTVLFTVHLFLAGTLLMLLLPRTTSNIVETLRAWPGRSLLIGLALVLTTPVVALMLVVTVLGLPIGLVLMALYFVALLVGVLATALCVGDTEARWFHIRSIETGLRRALMLLAGVVTLAILRAVPILGALVVPFSVLFGMGALTLWVYRTYSAPSPGGRPA